MKRNSIVKEHFIMIVIYSLVTLLNILHAQQNNNCSFGCLNCQQSSMSPQNFDCLQCDHGFMLKDNICLFKDCPPNTYLQRNVFSQNTQYLTQDSCKSICDYSFSENLSTNICDSQQKCSISYLNNLNISNQEEVESIYKISNFTIIIYPSFQRLVNTQTGQFISDMTDNTVVKEFYFQNFLLVFTSTNQVMKWDLNWQIKQTLVQIQQGVLNRKSSLFEIEKDQYAVSSYDDSSSIIYFTHIYLQNQEISQNYLISSFEYINCSLKVINAFVLCFGKNKQLITKKLVFIQQNLVLLDIIQDDRCQELLFTNSDIIQSIFLDFIPQQQILIIQQFMKQLIKLTYNKANQQFECQLTDLLQQPSKIRIVDLENQSYLLAINFNSQLIFFDEEMKNIHEINFPQNQITDIAFSKDKNSQFMTNYKLYTIEVINQKIEIFNINITAKSTTSIKTIPILIGQGTYFRIYQDKVLFREEINTIIDESLLFVVNSNIQCLNIQTNEIQFILAPFNKKKISHTDAINAMIYSEDSLYLLTCSQDGQIKVWYTLTSLNPSFLYTITQKGEYCRDILINKNYWGVALFSRSILVFSIRNQFIRYTYSFTNPQTDLSQFIVQFQKNIYLYFDNKFLLIDGISLSQISFGYYQDDQIIKVLPISETKIIIQNSKNELVLYQFDENQNYLFSYVENMFYSSQFGQFTYVSIDLISSNDFEIIVGCKNNTFLILNSSFQPQVIHTIPYGYPFNIKKYQDDNIYIIFGFNINGATKFFHYAIFRSSNKGIQYATSFNLSFNVGLHQYIDYLSHNNVQYLCTLPLSTQTIIIQGIFLAQTLGVSYSFFTSAYGKPLSSFTIKDNGSIQYYGNQEGILSFNSFDYQSYYKLDVDQEFVSGSINQVQVSPFLEQIFVVHYQIDLYCIYTYKQKGQMKFKNLYDQEKVINLIISNINRVAIAYKTKQLILKNYQTGQTYNLSTIQQIQGAEIDEANKQFYVYGSTLRIYKFDLTLQVEFTKDGSESYQQCINTNYLIICKINSNYLSIFSKNTKTQITSNQVVSQLNDFKIFVDENNSKIFLCTTFVQVLDFTGNKLTQIMDINQQIVDLQQFGNSIAILTQQFIFFYQRTTLIQISNIRPFGGGNLLGYYYISDFNLVAYYTDEIRYGQIFYYNLNTLSDDGFSIGSYTELGIGYVVSLFYDSYNLRLNYIDSAGQRTFNNVIKFLEFQTLGDPKKLVVEHTNNILFVYNSNIILYFNYNDNQKSTIVQTSKMVQFYFKYQPIDLSQTKYYFFDINNILYSYKDFVQLYLTYFDNTIRDVKQIDEHQIVILIFDDQILIYTQEQISKQIITSSNYAAIIKNPNIRRFLTNSIIQTNNLQLIHINYKFYLDGTNNWIKYSTNYDQDRQFLRNFIAYGQITSQKVIFSLSSGRVLCYNEQTLELKQILPVWDGQINIKKNFVKYFAITNNFVILGYQINIVRLVSLIDFSMVNQFDISAITFQTMNQLNILFVDELNNRIFVSYMYQKIIYILDLLSLSFQKNISFPNNQYNRISFNKEYIFAYSNSQINFYSRQNLEYVNFIKKDNELDQILNFMIVDETKLVLSINTQIEVHLINSDGIVKLLDQSSFTQPEIISAQMSQTDSNTLNIIGLSKDGIFEKRINTMVFSKQNSYITEQNQVRYSCYSQISMVNRIQGKTQFQQVYNQNFKNMDYIIFAQFGQQMNLMEFIQDPTIKVIIVPDIQNQNQTLNINENTFRIITRNQFYIENFSFILDQSNSQYLFSESTSAIKWQNITIKNQSLQNVQFLFKSVSSITISNLVIENITFNFQKSNNDQTNHWDQSLFQFSDCDNIYLSNITISQTTIMKQSLIFGFQNIKNVQIYNLTIINSNFYQIMLLQNGDNIQVSQINMINNDNPLRIPYRNQIEQNLDYSQENNEEFSISIIGFQNTTLQDITLKENYNILFLYYINSYQNDSEQVTLFDDEIQIQNCKIYQTQISQDISILTSKQVNQALLSIQSTQIYLINIQYNQNQGNILLQNSNIVKLQNSIFSNNTSLDGGALQFNTINQITIENCSLSQNIAKGSGGAIFSKEVKKLIFDDKSAVSLNQAEIGGGIRLISSQTDPTKTIVNQSRVYQNTAFIYGKDIGIYPFQIKVTYEKQIQRVLQQNMLGKQKNYHSNDNESIDNKQKSKLNFSRQLDQQYVEIKSFRSGDILPLNIVLFDQYDEIVAFSIQKMKNGLYTSSILQELKSFQIEITANESKHSQVIGQTFVNYNQYNQENNQFEFTSLQINAYPQTFQIFLLKIMSNSFSQLANFNVNLNIQFRQCEKGEILKTLQQYLQICEVCQNGFYSLIDPSQNSNQELSCIKCPAQASSCKGEEIVLKEGYWRQDKQSDDILQCNLLQQISTCQESDPASKQGCIQGYIGPLCSQCDFQGILWEFRYTLSSLDQSCQKCSNKELIVSFLIIFSKKYFFIILILLQKKFYIMNFQFFIIIFLKINIFINSNSPVNLFNDQYCDVCSQFHFSLYMHLYTLYATSSSFSKLHK